MARITALIALFLALAPTTTGVANADDGLEYEMLHSINRERVQEGLPALSEDWLLTSLAFERSGDMAARSYFSHVTPEGQTVFELMAERGFGYGAVSENLAHDMDRQGVGVAVAMHSLLSSSPHRVNLLDPTYTRIGVGIAAGQSGTYFTLLLGG
jgi:uncharacterized protein YkwD